MSLLAIGQSRAARRWIGALAVLVLAMRAAVPGGFASLTHFNRTFKNIVGESPTDYRGHLPKAM